MAASNGGAGGGGSEEDEETKLCSNCCRDIPLASFTLHQVHCSRNVTLCKLCQFGVNKSSWNEHQAQYHSNVKCEKCGEQVVKNQMELHSTDSCSYRKVTCDQCEIELFAKDMPTHEVYCKSRTEFCALCQSYVPVNVFDTHVCQPKPMAGTSTTSNRSDFAASDLALDGFQMADIVDSLDAEGKFLLDLQLQEIQRQKARELLNNSEQFDNTNSFLPFGLSSRESTFTDAPLSPPRQEVNCPNCNKSVNYVCMEDHLLSCTQVTKESTKNESFDKQPGTKACEYCSENIESFLYADHVRICAGSSTTPAYTSRINSNHKNGIAAHRSREAGANSGSTANSANKSEEEIPCEFCDKMVSFSQFEHHISICNQANDEIQELVPEEIYQRQSPIGNRSNTAHSSNPQLIDHEDNNEEAESNLPCEFCGKMCSFEKLMLHQANCEHSPHSSQFNWTNTSPTVSNHFPFGVDVEPRLCETRSDEFFRESHDRVQHRLPQPTRQEFEERTPDTLRKPHKRMNGMTSGTSVPKQPASQLSLKQNHNYQPSRHTTQSEPESRVAAAASRPKPAYQNTDPSSYRRVPITRTNPSSRVASSSTTSNTNSRAATRVSTRPNKNGVSDRLNGAYNQ